MNDEEIKAIERCKELIKKSHSCWIGITNQIAIETILNLIEKQKERIEYLERSISRKEDSLVEEEQDNVELETKLQEKDKTIYLMAEYIAKVVDCPYETEGIDMNCKETCEFGKDEECWKIYFENKVKESK